MVNRGSASSKTGRAFPKRKNKRFSKDTVAVLATLDTKAEETAFLADCIRRNGCTPWIVDVGTGGEPAYPGNTSRESVAAAAGYSLQALTLLPRAHVMEAAARGALQIVGAMLSRQEVHAVVAVGGGSGTWLGMTVMRALPIGVPKLMVSTLPIQEARTDIMVLSSVVDISGLNRILIPVLANAAAAICGMARSTAIVPDVSRPTIALTMFGVTTRGGTLLRRFLENHGCEVLVFHANGFGGATMETLAAHGMFAGVVDWTTTEVTDEVAGGVCSAGPARLEAAGTAGIPQVVVPGAVDMINFHYEIPEAFRGRLYHITSPNTVLVRTSVDESRIIGRWMARKLNLAQGPVRILIPGAGFSALDAPGGVFENREANDAFVSSLRRELRANIPIEVLPHHINDEAFAQATASAMLSMNVARTPDKATRVDPEQYSRTEAVWTSKDWPTDQ